LLSLVQSAYVHAPDSASNTGQAGKHVGMHTCVQASFRGVPVTAVTATATEAVAEDILTTLGISDSAQRFKVQWVSNMSM
jgi:hypothetical protein